MEEDEVILERTGILFRVIQAAYLREEGEPFCRRLNKIDDAERDR